MAACLGPLVAAAPRRPPSATGSTSTRPTSGPNGGKIILVGGVAGTSWQRRRARAALPCTRSWTAHPSNSPVGLRVGVNAGTGVRLLARLRAGAAAHLLDHRRRHEPCRPRHGSALTAPGARDRGVLVRARNPFETEAVPPFKVKGKSEAVVAFAVGAPRQSVSGSGRRRPSLHRQRGGARGTPGPGARRPRAAQGAWSR